MKNSTWYACVPSAQGPFCHSPRGSRLIIDLISQNNWTPSSSLRQRNPKRPSFHVYVFTETIHLYTLYAARKAMISSTVSLTKEHIKTTRTNHHDKKKKKENIPPSLRRPRKPKLAPVMWLPKTFRLTRWPLKNHGDNRQKSKIGKKQKLN